MVGGLEGEELKTRGAVEVFEKKVKVEVKLKRKGGGNGKGTASQNKGDG